MDTVKLNCKKLTAIFLVSILCLTSGIIAFAGDIETITTSSATHRISKEGSTLWITSGFNSGLTVSSVRYQYSMCIQLQSTTSSSTMTTTVSVDETVNASGFSHYYGKNITDYVYTYKGETYVGKKAVSLSNINITTTFSNGTVDVASLAYMK